MKWQSLLGRLARIDLTGISLSAIILFIQIYALVWDHTRFIEQPVRHSDSILTGFLSETLGKVNVGTKVTLYGTQSRI